MRVVEIMRVLLRGRADRAPRSHELGATTAWLPRCSRSDAAREALCRPGRGGKERRGLAGSQAAGPVPAAIISKVDSNYFCRVQPARPGRERNRDEYGAISAIFACSMLKLLLVANSWLCTWFARPQGDSPRPGAVAHPGAPPGMLFRCCKFFQWVGLRDHPPL